MVKETPRDHILAGSKTALLLKNLTPLGVNIGNLSTKQEVPGLQHNPKHPERRILAQSSGGKLLKPKSGKNLIHIDLPRVGLISLYE